MVEFSINLQTWINTKLSSESAIESVLAYSLKVPLEVVTALLLVSIVFGLLWVAAEVFTDAQIPILGAFGTISAFGVAAYNNEIQCELGNGN